MLAVSRIVDLNPVMHSESSNSYGISVRKRDVNTDLGKTQVSRGEPADDALVQASSGGEDSKLLTTDSDSTISVSWSVSVAGSVQDIDPRGLRLPGDSEQASAQSAVSSSPMAVDATEVLDIIATSTGSTQLEASSLPLVHDMDVDMAVTAVEMRDFTAAAKSVQPTAKREGFAVVPDVTWGEFLC
jgi:hypothetical protein